ncbi:MAG TPA: ligase-associated DNA damage response endonuclease PdeM [Puia sp.]|nr:ligase-associated DNA damage response endonuclease PdeM [Puia sp.]
MQIPFSYRIKDQQLWLSPDRCIFWEEERSLILSDLHFGKTGHFRKSGIAVPQHVYKEDLQRLLALIQHFQPRQLLVVGDLFHSQENKELELFQKWRDDFSGLEIQLIKGNHDILHADWYRETGIRVSHEYLKIGDFLFIHDITTAGEPGTHYSFSGHIHPGVTISGAGRQSLRFPCFYFGEDYAVLPAFSRFTGTASMERSPGSAIFAILPADPLKKQKGSVLQIH